MGEKLRDRLTLERNAMDLWLPVDAVFDAAVGGTEVDFHGFLVCRVDPSVSLWGPAFKAVKCRDVNLDLQGKPKTGKRENETGLVALPDN